jgi:hypothetical protein
MPFLFLVGIVFTNIHRLNRSRHRVDHRNKQTGSIRKRMRSPTQHLLIGLPLNEADTGTDRNDRQMMSSQTPESLQTVAIAVAVRRHFTWAPPIGPPHPERPRTAAPI